MTKRSRICVFLTLTLSLLLSGCMMTASVNELYALPQLPSEYQTLNAQIDTLLAAGLETISPASGVNLQSVQLEDLDGDGVQEAIAFFRSNDEERPLKIYIFRACEDVYEQAAVIEGSGTSLHSIRYLDMNADGVKELLVSWRVSTQVQALSVYSLDQQLTPAALMSAAYARYETVDLDGDELLELVVLRSDEGETGNSLADFYDWDGSNLLLRSSARLSVAVSELQWMQEGQLENNECAVFVTGRVAGADETSRAVTDILVCREGELKNIVLSQSTGVSSQIARFLNIQPTDINADGVTEVPAPAALPTAQDDEKWKIYWLSMAADGTASRQAITYHNLTDSWYLLVPDTWDGHFTVSQDNTGTTEHATTFFSLSGGQIREKLFTIYTLTGDNRETQANRGGKTILRRQPNTIYAIEYAESYADWYYSIEEKELATRFHAIAAQWITGEE